ncbi:hypothetical protein DEU35_1998 [Microbacterium sp. AG157]|uniref:hypothetical protein n=1 Tax=Microbacterium sp. AG157 TaxID=2183993 RepID=UPI000E27EB2B|nr:hypothetical protein [Microbacterium sp. AG157]REC97507.1 hypothetical protein DEU35_1998 [Microbacterium sp. AG157]
MDDDEDSLRRVRFYGVHDLSTGWQLPRVVEVVEHFDPENPPADTVDVLELFNVEQYLTENILPSDYSAAQRSDAMAKLPQIRGVIARHFSAINEGNFAEQIAGVDWQFRDDLLELLGRHGAFKRCDGQTVLNELQKIRMHVGQMLAHQALVKAYDADLTTLLLSTPANAEILIRKHIEGSSRSPIFTPSSLSTAQSRGLIASYLDSEEANLNFVRLVRDARTIAAIGLDAKLKLQAKRRHEEMTKKFFEENNAIKTGYGVGLSDDQDEPVRAEMNDDDGWSVQYTYSVAWLEDTLDEPSILNNFMHVFEFVDDQALLTMPSYANQIGAIEGLFGSKGKDDYATGSAFGMVDSLTFLRLHIYVRFLESKNIEIEKVIQWFFESYILEEFGAANFSFTPSAQSTSYLTRARQLFAEMESIASQFDLYAQEGHLDRDLLAIGADQVRYKSIASLVADKYAYPVDGSTVSIVIFQLFSDQSPIHYISEDLNADSAEELLTTENVSYDDFRPDQRHVVDFLIENGAIEKVGSRILITNRARLRILRSFYDREAVNISHLSTAGKEEIKSMAEMGWVTVESTLLTAPEGTYFNYMLNTLEHGNGPKLRNKYLHGTQANGATENEHAIAYTRALRLLIAIVIKINDDFCSQAEVARMEGEPSETL